MPRCTLPQDLGLLSVSRILFYFIMLRTLLRFFALLKIKTLLFSRDYALFDQKHGGVPIYLCQCIPSKGKRNWKLGSRSGQCHANDVAKISKRLSQLPLPTRRLNLRTENRMLLTASCRPANDVELHEVGRPANAHRCTGHNPDDIAFAHQPLFQQALLRNLREPVHLLHVSNAPSHPAPHPPQPPPPPPPPPPRPTPP